MSSKLEPPFASDPRGMAALIDGIPEQIEDALERCAAQPWKHVPRMPSTLLVGAMGGSAIAADLTAALYADRLPRPLVVVRDYRWPGFATREAFALLCSYSGATEETLALYAEARHRGLPRAALTTGGALAAICEKDGATWHKLPGGMPPRAALYSSWVALSGLLCSLDWCDDPAPDWREAAARVRELRERIGTAVPEERNPAKQLARALLGRNLVIYSGARRTAPAATRLRQQLNENAKLLAHSAAVPELNHNEIVGWERPESYHRHATVLVLNDPEDGSEIARRLELTSEAAAERGAEVRKLEGWTGARLARIVQMVAFGDYLSFYLAVARDVDPTPVATIDEFKRRMNAAGRNVA